MNIIRIDDDEDSWYKWKSVQDRFGKNQMTHFGLEGKWSNFGNKFCWGSKLKITSDQERLEIINRFRKKERRFSFEVYSSSQEFSDMVLTLFAVSQ